MPILVTCVIDLYNKRHYTAAEYNMESDVLAS